MSGRRIALAVMATLLVASLWQADRWIAATPISALDPQTSVAVVDRNGLLLRAFTTDDGRWRLAAEPEEVDPGYLAQLVAYEDKRFYRHAGVDLLAMVRAVAQAVWHTRVVSGGSTLTMQVARLLQGAPTGKLSAKFTQIRLALALERRLTKDQILKLYLTLTPFGGNIEGVRAASLVYFGKEPGHLTSAEAALLVALPQSPEARRPDRNPQAAQLARDRVLARMVGAGVLAAGDALAARTELVPTARLPFPQLAPHLAEQVRAADPATGLHTVAIDRPLQRRIEALVRARVQGFGAYLSAAALVADHATGEVLAAVGSPELYDEARDGHVDMTRAVRSPGSTLKPLIYGLAFEAGLAHPESLVEDRPTAFGRYVPVNFDGRYRGTVSVRDALQMSLNVPAVAALDAVGPARLMARMRRAGLHPRLPDAGAPGLAIGLGGVGISLRDLVALFAGIARGGKAVHLSDRPVGPENPDAPRLLSPEAAWQVADILRGAPAPKAAATGRIAFKTGTSYGYRDAWAVGFDGRHVVGVWIGRPDGASAPGTVGIDQAAQMLFEVFGRLGADRVPLPAPPAGVLTVTHAELPMPLRRLRGPVEALNRSDFAPEIAFPPDAARVDLGIAGGRAQAPLALKLRGGTPPFIWMVNDIPLAADAFDRSAAWHPDGPGFTTISVVDAEGLSDRVSVYLE